MIVRIILMLFALIFAFWCLIKVIQHTPFHTTLVAAFKSVRELVLFMIATALAIVVVGFLVMADKIF